MTLKLMHNPRCSQSREALRLLTQSGAEPQVVLYLAVPPTEDELRTLLKKLGMGPRELIRASEPQYKALGLDGRDVSDADLIAAMAKNPILIQRPILIAGSRAIVARPPERVLELL